MAEPANGDAEIERYAKWRISFDRATRIRGQYITGVIGIEHSIDGVLEDFLYPHSDARLPLRTAMLASMRLPGKIATLDAMLSECELEGDFTDLVGRLRKVNELRNRFAHHQIIIAADQEDRDPPTFTLRASGKRDKTITPEEMAALLDQLEELSAALLLLGWEIVKRRSETS